MSNSFTLDRLPPGVDLRQCFTTEEFFHVQKDFSLAVELPKAVAKPEFPAHLEVRQLQIFFDERLCLSWNDGEIAFEIFLPDDYPLRTMAIAINGELGYVLANGQVCLDRLENIDLPLMVTKSHVARQRQTRNQAN